MDKRSATMLTVCSPYDGNELQQLAEHTAADVEAALARADALHRARKPLPLHERLEILERTANLMQASHEKLASLAASEGGKPIVDSRVEVTRAIDSVRLCVEHMRSDQGSVIPMRVGASSAGRVAFTQKFPIGVVVAVSAFNHPLNLIAHQVAPAVAAGCPVIVKPAPDTPLSCLALLDLLFEAGLPEEWAQALIVTDNDVAEALVTDTRVAFFSFIGSARVGWMLRSKLAAGTRCALEHGGVAPVIVCADADLESAAKTLAKGAFYHAGQVCVSVQRVFVHETVHADFVAAFVREAEAQVVGDPLDDRTTVGPLIRAGEVGRVHEWVEEACKTGQLASGGGAVLDQCYAPTVVVDPADEARLSTAEVFGPVACTYPFDAIEDACRRANALPVSFQAAVFTRDIDRMMAAYQGLDASAVMVNDHTAFRIDGMPFAGLRHSGLGVGGVPHTLDDMQIEKMMVLRSEGFSP